MKILVTGASGFVGSHLIEQLLKNDHEVVALVRNPRKIELKSPRLTLITADLDHTLYFDENLLNSIEVVIHTAGIVHAYNNLDFYKVNSEGTINLINALKSIPKLKFILISSLAARGPNHLLNEDQPVSDYGKSKKLAEEKLHSIAPSSWTKIIIRPPMVIGPKDTAVLDIFKMIQDGFVLLPGLDSKQKKYSFVCVYDLVQTINLCLSFEGNALFYSSYSTETTFSNLMRVIQSKMNKKSVIYFPVPKIMIVLFANFLSFIHKFFPHQLRITPDKTKELFPSAWICENKSTCEKLGQNFSYDLEKTIALTLSDYQNRKWIK
jgi:nucleoside-diphosphate-sugar epimerase